MCRFASITDWGHLDLGSVLLLLGIKSYASGIWQLVRREYVKCETSSFGAVWQFSVGHPFSILRFVARSWDRQRSHRARYVRVLSEPFQDPGPPKNCSDSAEIPLLRPFLRDRNGGRQVAAILGPPETKHL